MKKFMLLAVAGLFATAALHAQTRTKEIGFQSDNDSFLAQGSDRYYTNGFFLFYRKAVDTARIQNKNIANKVFGLELGQKIFNAQSGRLPSADYIDRPVAGYLYLGASANILYKNETTFKLTGRVGVVGPASGGYAIQKFIHNTFGFYELNTWQYQIQNDVELNLNAEANKLLARASWVDITASGYVNLGNGFTGAGVGPLLRLGNFNQLFQSVSTQSTASYYGDSRLLHKHELFFYYKPMANLVAYDATIQGSLLRDHPVTGTQEITLDKKPFIFSNQFGVSYASNRIVLDLGVVVQTRDTKQMVHSTHQWGSIGLMYRFN
ncbi:lipid A deacylase LpxR family protein [Mucilaginibacter achroorhodeus]|uniref:Lipid A deacylase LpxR family protein n=1 Tax=Mucilaginibacter achroorhodeus TaxID=2599294 RepID=A0A563TWT9_9SPHI|nr:lipid A deacylase LpxR family protein [Mucilaginibacter achroorhodeus]TWR23815.1 lipid A deacylase LpxR family protein [Mucilaginibacter achroorhodeus]